MERATRYGLCVPVTTIGIAPILIRDQRATHPPIYLQAYHNRIPRSHRLDRGRPDKYASSSGGWTSPSAAVPWGKGFIKKIKQKKPAPPTKEAGRMS